MGRVIERVQGAGAVFQGETRLGGATYEITVYQDTQTIEAFGPSGPQQIDTMQRITGRVSPEPPLDDFEMLGKVLTLHLEDGRRWDFVIGGHEARNAGKGLYKV